MKIQIRNNERVIFVGATGSGKTMLAKHLLKRLSRILVIDPKHTFRMEGFEIHTALPRLGVSFRVIYRPTLADDESLARALLELMRGRHATIYCDELATLSEMYPLSTGVLENVTMTGREPHVAVWCAVQRPRGVPRVFFTEAEVIFMFNLRSGEDRAYMTEFAGPEVAEPIERYTFWYAHAEEAEPALMRLDLNKNYIEKIG